MLITSWSVPRILLRAAAGASVLYTPSKLRVRFRISRFPDFAISSGLAECRKCIGLKIEAFTGYGEHVFSDSIGLDEVGLDSGLVVVWNYCLEYIAIFRIEAECVVQVNRSGSDEFEAFLGNSGVQPCFVLVVFISAQQQGRDVQRRFCRKREQADRSIRRFLRFRVFPTLKSLSKSSIIYLFVIRLFAIYLLIMLKTVQGFASTGTPPSMM